MRSTILSIWHLCVLFAFQVFARPHDHGKKPPLPPPSYYGAWGSCGSSIGLEPADALGALACAWTIPSSQGKTIAVGRNDEPKLLCDDYGAKIWIAPFTNNPYRGPEEEYIFKTSDVVNFTLQNALQCCDKDLNPTTCSGWGMLSHVQSRSDVLISINHSDRPEQVSCNQVGNC
ncbi:hypothetical protein F5B21DRAFT_500778 [Xylaria acuta]|nr:hypothetical protein F5B21DRAFT_500778 [Xylaria acuta]